MRLARSMVSLPADSGWQSIPSIAPSAHRHPPVPWKAEGAAIRYFAFVGKGTFAAVGKVARCADRLGNRRRDGGLARNLKDGLILDLLLRASRFGFRVKLRRDSNAGGLLSLRRLPARRYGDVRPAKQALHEDPFPHVIPFDAMANKLQPVPGHKQYRRPTDFAEEQNGDGYH